ncbi:MAG: ricin-type beta-trefoil lectin domain protein [Pseudomonadota bacterium]
MQTPPQTVAKVVPRYIGTNFIAIALTVALFVPGCITADDVSAPAATALSPGSEYTGRIRLSRFLDEPDGYCLDVPGPPQNVMLQFPLVAHTCHADPLADQVFSFNDGGSGQIRWTMEAYDLCFTADAADGKSALNLGPCEASPMQTFEYSVGREIQLSGTELCVHVERTGPGSFQPVAEGQDDYGRGRSANPQFTHLMRRLELRPCGDGDPSMSRWQAMDDG